MLKNRVRPRAEFPNCPEEKEQYWSAALPAWYLIKSDLLIRPEPKSEAMPRARLRDLGLTVGALPTGPFNAITDVAGVKVGYSTVIQDQPRIARTGVTAIWPRGPEIWTDYVFAGTFSFNGNGEMTGLPWLAEQGLLGAPIGITNTYQVGIVRDAITAIAVRDGASQAFHLPVVAETYDGWLSDIQAFTLTQEHAFAAFDSAVGGCAIAEGNVGGGTGMICHEFKGGTGTASRVVVENGERYTVGALERDDSKFDCTLLWRSSWHTRWAGQQAVSRQERGRWRLGCAAPPCASRV